MNTKAVAELENLLPHLNSEDIKGGFMAMISLHRLGGNSDAAMERILIGLKDLKRDHPELFTT